jgi:hypothetical protein
MRLSLAALAVSMTLASTAQAIPITWNLDATVTATNLPALGPIALGDVISASMTLETDTPVVHIPFASGTGYFNVFDAFTLTVAGRTLTLGPDSADMGFAREANWLGTSNFADFQSLQMAALLSDGTDVFQAYLSFEFTDLAAFPIGTLPSSPPSLASARLRELWLYSPIDGDPRNGAISIAGSEITSFTSRSVPEPSTLTLLLAGLALVWVARRESGNTHRG